MSVLHFTWTVKDFDMCPQPPGQAIESPCFSIDERKTTKFSLCLYPRGHDKQTTGETYVSLFLKRHCDNGSELVMPYVGMCLIDASNNLTSHVRIKNTFRKNEYYGRQYFIKRKDLLGEQRDPRFSEKVLTVFCIILHQEVKEVRLRIFKHEDFTNLSSDLSKLLESGNHSDITIRVCGKEFKAHTFILESRCPALMRKLVKLEGSNIYSIPFIEASVLHMILHYLYTGAYCDDAYLENILIVLNTKELSDLRSSLYPPSPCNISATTEINVVNVKHIWNIRELDKLELNEKQSCYLWSNDNPTWSWLKISLIKTNNEDPCECVLIFKRMHTNISTLCMQCVLVEGRLVPTNRVAKKLEHTFEKESEWTTTIKIAMIQKGVVMLNIHLSACDSDSDHSSYLNREHRSFFVDLVVDEKRFQRDLRNVHRNMEYADVKLRVGNQEISAHKAILSCRSEVFAKMFEHDTKEKQTGVVDIEDVDESSMSSLVMYMYCGDIDAPLCVPSTLKLYAAADKYQVLLLKEKCSQYLQQTITVKNVAEILSLAALHVDDALKQNCYDFVTSHFDQIQKDKESFDALKNKINLYPDIFEALSPRISRGKKRFLMSLSDDDTTTPKKLNNNTS